MVSVLVISKGSGIMPLASRHSAPLLDTFGLSLGCQPGPYIQCINLKHRRKGAVSHQAANTTLSGNPL